MKKLIYILIAVFGVAFVACEPDEVTINTLDPAEAELIAAELNTPDVNVFEIVQTTDAEQGNETEQAVALSWTAASGDNNRDLMYYVQMDVAGNDFANAATIPLAQNGTSELTRSLTFGELNNASTKIGENLLAIASALAVNYDEANDFEVRVEIVLGNAIAKTYSNVITISVTPYYTGLPDELLVSGAALSEDVAIASTDGVFEGQLNLTNDTFRFFAQPAETNISYNYEYFESNGYTIDPLLENANDAEMNFNFTGSEGPWDFVLDTNTKTITLIEVVAPDNLYIIGSLTGWDPATAFPFNNNGDNTFTIAVNLVDGDQFKFIPTLGTWDGAWKEDPNNPGSIINEGGDPNISGFLPGQYLITVDFNTLTFEVKAINELYLVGSLTGWDPATSLTMSKASTGVFSIKLNLQADDEFKFLPTNTGWDGDFGDDPNNPGFSFDGEGEKNLSIDTAGDYIVSYNYTTNTIDVSPIIIPTELYIVGSFRGWSNDAGNPQLTEMAPGVFEVTQDFSMDDEFKFVKSNSGGDWANDMGENSNHPGVIEQDGESNIKIKTSGTYKVTVNFNNGTIAVVLQ